MGRDKSLEEFLGGGEEDAEESAEPAETTDTEAKAVPTADWSPDGAECAQCGAVVERRWRQGEAMVCGECKEW